MKLLTAALLFCACTTLSATPASAQQADRPTRRVIPNRYVVVLAPQQASAVVNVATAVAEAHNAQVVHVYRHALQGMAVRMTAAGAAAMAADPRVESVMQDEAIFIGATRHELASPDTAQTDATWGLDRIDQRDRPLNTTYVYNFTAAGVHAYVIDTGIRATHSEFTGRVGNGVDFVNDGEGTNDCNGHGTHVAGTIGGTVYGVAKQVILHPVRTFDCDGRTDASTVIAAVDWVTANHVKPAVANMSISGAGYAPLDTAVMNSIDAGVTYVVAAGTNDVDACTESPARVGAAITVGASDMTDVRSTFSNWGTCVDLFAPGSGITSASFTGDSATNTMDGTSTASPHVAGVAALYLSQHGNRTPADVAAAIVGNASVDKLLDIETGSPNRLLYSLWPVPLSAAIPLLWPVPVTQVGGTVPLWAFVRNTSAIPLPADARVWFLVNGPGFNSWVGSASVAGLAPGATAWFSYNWTIPSGTTPGAHEYRAQVWTDIAPLSSLVGPQAFDVAPVVIAADITSLWPVTNAAQGTSATLWALVRNTGTAALPADARVWFLVAGPSFTSWVGSASVSGLAPGATAWYSYNWSIPSNQTIGNYEYRSQVWTNTAPLSALFGPQAFSIATPVFQANVQQLWEVVGIQKGTSAPLWALVRNTGTVTLPADARVWFHVTGPSYMSWVGFASVAGLAPGATAWYSFDWTAPAGLLDGDYRYHAQVWTNTQAISNYQGPMAFPVNGFQSQVYLLWPVSGAARNATVPLWAHVYNQSNTPLPAGAIVRFFVVGPSYSAWVGSTLVQGLPARKGAWFAFDWTIPGTQPLGAYNYFALVWTSTNISTLAGPQAFSILTFTEAGGLSFAAPPDPFMMPRSIDDRVGR
jgi:hypothetical protein